MVHTFNPCPAPPQQAPRASWQSHAGLRLAYMRGQFILYVKFHMSNFNMIEEEVETQVVHDICPEWYGKGSYLTLMWPLPGDRQD